MGSGSALLALPPWLHVPPWALAWLHRASVQQAGTAIGKLATSLARHTGIPAVLVAAVGLVLAFRVARRALHLVFEVALALALVFAATRAGWLRF